MASHEISTSTLALILTFFLITLLIPQTHSQSCTSQKLTNNKSYSNCTDLPHLSSYLHYTYNSSNSSLSVAFLATPASPSGWIAWAINPTGSGMIGAQALIAFELDGSMTVKKYNISAYRLFSESKLSFEVWDLSAEKSGGMMMIYATVAVAKNETVNQVWQVGSVVTDGVPQKHATSNENLNSKGTIELVSGEKNGTDTGTNTGTNNGTDTGTKEKSSAEKMSTTVWFVCFVSFFVMLLSLFL